MFRTAVRLGLVSIVCAAVVHAPLAQQRPVFRSDAQFVIVDAYPLRDGKVVEGLTAADFAITEEGVAQAIDTFEFVAGGAAEPESARRDPNSLAESRALVADPRNRAFIVDLDIDHVSVAGAHRIRVPLVQMLNQMLSPNDLFGVTTTKHTPGTLTFGRKVVTTDDMLSRYWAWGTRDSAMKDEDERGIVDCFAYKLTQQGPVERVVPDGARMRKLPDVIIERHRELKVLDHLDDLVEYAGHLREGQTSIVIVTEGWRLQPPDPALIREIEDTQGMQPPAPANVGGRLTMFDTVTEGHRGACILMGQRIAREDPRARMRELIQRANSRNVSFFPVNPAGLVVFDSPASEVVVLAPNANSSMGDDFERVTTRSDGLRTLADNTDGVAVVGNNDLRAGLRRVTEELRSFYLLGYYSTNRTFDGRVRRIRVKAGDLEVRARRSYRAPTEEERIARANPVAASGPSPVQLALDVLSGLRSADDRTFNVSRYLKADAAPVLGVPAVFRATPSPRSPSVPVTAPAFTRQERLHVEWPVHEPLTERSARLLGRNGQPLAVAVTLTERAGASGPLIVADAALGPLAPGDYVVELRVSSASGSKVALVAFRVVP
ncbi:MAG TPA: VWA domain-containing protein [Vicinamibacterales bacterium]|nr:VWA domain-containing protein [Vicinamibacterales bacterium]